MQNGVMFLLSSQTICAHWGLADDSSDDVTITGVGKCLVFMTD